MNNQQYTERIVAFVDILGFRKMVNDSIVDNNQQMVIAKALDVIYGNKRLNDKFESDLIDAQVTVFSDSIVISYPLECKDALFLILMNMIHIQIELAGLGIFVRGGISIGKCVHTRYIIYGPAMNMAYELESKYAIYPRIIIPKVFFQKGLQYCDSADDKEFMDMMNSLVELDDDGYYFVNFITQSQELDYPEYTYYMLLSTIRKTLVESLNIYHNDNNIGAKYKWFLKYWNYIFKGKKYSIPYDSTIEDSVSEIRARYEALVIEDTYPYN